MKLFKAERNRKEAVILKLLVLLKLLQRRGIIMKDLFQEMKSCKTINDCINVATLDAYDEYEEATGWQVCMQTLFEEVKQVKVLGEDVQLEGFDLVNELYVVAICRRKNKEARVTPESIEFPRMTKKQTLWMKAWIEYSNG